MTQHHSSKEVTYEDTSSEKTPSVESSSEENSSEESSSEEASSDEASPEDAYPEGDNLPQEVSDTEEMLGGFGKASNPELREDLVADGKFVQDDFVQSPFAKDVKGAEDFSRLSLSERTRKAYKRAWLDFEAYCEEVGQESLPARPVVVAAYLNRRARKRPTERGARKERSEEDLSVSTLEQRLSAIRHVHETEGYRSPTGRPQVAKVMQGIRNDTDR